ncbi:protein kinase family protein, putative [Ichthyophthirius multifiliis]|uniref:Protein kinase family protein, putative n=1 Tax=Ichthyophthirius multifiliis TaxID=5932 RepID=G0QLY2_ICHMU|nr:protein kinase family protein, putative [Ichthyophthirius multifiliis]EGR33772.1 protein kinase family protein, putative [Ichthyophthirius multifiliis]|eukprot:XP_004038996.1 protein kinase family protein, putative [Ichthyophthirius multifiliis]
MEIQLDYFQNGPLFDLVVKKKQLDENEARFYFLKVCNAINFLKQNNICHRDIKLSNIMLDNENNPILIDFGFALEYNQQFTIEQTLEHEWLSQEQSFVKIN